MKRIPPWLRWLLVAILAGLVVFYLYPSLADYLAVDACLDAGGRWVEEARACEY